jgi:hypothetical protein
MRPRPPASTEHGARTAPHKDRLLVPLTSAGLAVFGGVRHLPAKIEQDWWSDQLHEGQGLEERVGSSAGFGRSDARQPIEEGRAQRPQPPLVHAWVPSKAPGHRSLSGPPHGIESKDAVIARRGRCPARDRSRSTQRDRDADDSSNHSCTDERPADHRGGGSRPHPEVGRSKHFTPSSLPARPRTPRAALPSSGERLAMGARVGRCRRSPAGTLRAQLPDRFRGSPRPLVNLVS